MQLTRRAFAGAVLAVATALSAAVTPPAFASGYDHWGADRQSAGRDGYNSFESRITAGSAYLLRSK